MSSMKRYDILQKLPSKPPVRVGAATTLEDATNRWNELTVMFPGDYFIVDSDNSASIVRLDAEHTRESVKLPRGASSPEILAFCDVAYSG